MQRLMLVVVAAVIALSSPALARIWHISPDGTGDVPTINAGVDAAADGDILLLDDGVYQGSGNTNISFDGKAITIGSASGDPFNCVIDCQGSGSNWCRGALFYFEEGPGSVLEGITISNGYAYEGGGIWCWRSSPTITNCILLGNVATHSGGGVYCGGGSSPVITNVTLFENGAMYGGSMYSIDDSRPQVYNTIISYTLNGAAVGVGDAYSIPDFYCCDLYGNADGDWTGSIHNQLGINGNMCVDPLFCMEDNPDAPYSISSCSPCAGINHPECGLVGAADVGCEISAVIAAAVDIDPNTINVRSRGRWLTCHIEFADGADAADIDISTVKINGQVSAQLDPAELGDYNTNGVTDLMVKFSRTDVVDIVDEVGMVELVVTGLVAGQEFSGSEEVRVMGARERKCAADTDIIPIVANIRPTGHLTAGEEATILYAVPEAGFTRITIFDVRGRVVTTLIEEMSAPGVFEIGWDGRDSFGSNVASGIYFTSLQTANEVVTGKIMVVK